MPGTVLGTGNRSVNKTDTNPTFVELMLWYGEADHKHNT